MQLCACHLYGNQKPSVLVIGVERLGFNVVSCGADPYLSRDLPGFATFCEESVRFTHAYTPSTMSQSTWASVLTAQFPLQTGVHDNGTDFLSAEFNTVAESAIAQNYHTAFFSGGPPIFRKSGLVQGFELFDDSIFLTQNRLYRTARNTFDHLNEWIGELGELESFFAAVHIADLQFPEVTTVSLKGEVRERSFTSQLGEVGEALNILVTQLKKIKRWDQTTVILMGLNGSDSLNELHSSSTQVALFIKPVRKAGQEPREWKIDRSTSLVDVGRTLFDLMNLSYLESTPALSLVGFLETPHVQWPDERFLISETALRFWRGGDRIRGALRSDPYLFIYDKHPELFNTLVDKLETAPFPSEDPHQQKFLAQMKNFGYGPYLDTPTSTPLYDTSVTQALQNHTWSKLEQLGVEHHQDLWQLVAKKNLNKKFVKSFEGCGKIFTGEANPDCTDKTLNALYIWIHEARDSEKKLMQEKFLALYHKEILGQRISRLNALREYPWDTNLKNLNPTLSDLFLNLPENHKYLTLTKNKILKEDIAFDLNAPFEF